MLIEWHDRNPKNATFEGTAREILRVQQPAPIHPLGEMTFNPVARRGDPDWRVMYIGSGDAGTGEQRDIRRMNPQRLDTIAGKILRIVPDLREHTATSTVSENGRYRIPNDNPFTGLEGARKEIWAYGLRNPHRLIWNVDPAGPATRSPELLAFNIGLTAWESVVIVHKGANYGYSLREGPQMMSVDGMSAVPANDVIPIQISDTVTRGTVTPRYPVVQYPHTAAIGGDAIAGGFIYRGSKVPALKNKLIFGDITTGRIWSADLADVLAADDTNPATVAEIHEIDAGLRGIVERTYRARGGKGEALPGTAVVSGRGRVDLRFATDNDGELYILTKSDGMIRKVIGARSDVTHCRDSAESRSARRRRKRTAPGTPAGGVTSAVGRAGVDRRGKDRLRDQLRRLPRQQGARGGQGRDHDLDHRRAGWKTGAGPDRQPVGPRFDRRRNFLGHQEGPAAVDDGGMGRPHLRHRDPEHHQLHSHARTEVASGSAGPPPHHDARMITAAQPDRDVVRTWCMPRRRYAFATSSLSDSGMPESTSSP